MSAPLKQPKTRLYCMISRVLSSRRPGGLAGQCAVAQPRRVWSCRGLRTPSGSEQEEGVSPRAGCGVRTPARRMKGRWIPGKTKALRDLRIPDKPRGKPPWLLAV